MSSGVGGKATVATAEFLKRGCVSPIDIEFRNITYTVMQGAKRETKTILKGVSGKFSHGSLTGILGPSGAGKSSLMNVIAGYRVHNVEGDIFLNRRRRNLEAFRKQACYIMQEDRLIEELTAYESLVYSAHLKLSRKAVSGSQRISLINEILELMGMSQCAHTRVAKLSGGQKKRLSIALELIQNTPILLLDEPTTGLDSVSCYQCVSMLQKLARGGRTVICTIHQPSAKIFELFDELYFVVDGQCVYDGPVRNLVSYLRRHGLHCPPYHNPIDFMMETAVNLHGSEALEQLKATIRERDVRNRAAIARGLALQNERRENEVTRPEVAGNGKTERSSICDRLLQPLHAFRVLVFGERRSDIKSYYNKDQVATLDNRSASEVDATQLLRTLETDVKVQKEISNSEAVSYRPCASAVSSNAAAERVSTSTNQPNTVIEVVGCTLDRDGQTFQQAVPGPWTTASARCASEPSDGMQRLQVLLHRTGVCLWRDGMLNHIRWISAALFGFIVGLLFYNTANDGHRTTDVGSCLLFHGMFIIYVTIMTSVLRLPLETLLVVKEHVNGWYDVHTYFWARMIVDLPLQLAVPVIYSSIVYYMMGLPMDPTRFAMFVGVMTVSSLCAASFAYLLSAICTVQTALFVAPMFSTPQLLFSGYFLSLDAIPAYLKWISYTSFSRFCFSATILSLYGPINGVPAPKLSCEPAQARQCYDDPQTIISMFGMQHSNYMADCLVLAGYSVLFRVLSYFILRRRVKTR